MRKLRVWVLLVFACCLSACTSGRPAASEPERPTRPAPAQVGQIRIPEEPLPADIHLPAVYYLFINGDRVEFLVDFFKVPGRPPMFFPVPNYIGYYIIDENREGWFVPKTSWKALGAAIGQDLIFRKPGFPLPPPAEPKAGYPSRYRLGHMTLDDIYNKKFRLSTLFTYIIDTWGVPPDDDYTPVITGSVEVNRGDQLPKENRHYHEFIIQPNGRVYWIRRQIPHPGYELLNPPKSRYPAPEEPLAPQR